MPQFTLPLSLPVHYSQDNFYLSTCNKAAHDWVMRWPNWPSHALIISGPQGCGKSHLAHLWRKKSGAQTMPANNIHPEAISGHILIENIETTTDQTQLFHLFNHSKERGVSLLMTSGLEPAGLPFNLPDLTSRLKACPLAIIQAPDDNVLIAALRKQFSDRQLMIDEDVIAYLIPRIERSFSGVSRLVEMLDKEALTGQKNITIPFVRRFV